MRPLRILVLDAYAPEGREALCGAGGTEAGALYRAMLERLAPGVEVEVAYPADAPAADGQLPEEPDLADYDGLAWTGSSLTIHDRRDPRVGRQVELARAAYRAGVPSFGSCWAAQLAVVASGGRCARHPKGREFGIARRIRLSAEGTAHPLFAGRPAVFDAFTSHEDEVVELASGTLLASNDWSRVQAVSVQRGPGVFWALQYHPEYDLREVASLCRLRRDELVRQGCFPSVEAAEQAAEEMEALHTDPSRRDLAESLGVGCELLDFGARTIEARNWLDFLTSRVARAERR